MAVIEQMTDICACTLEPPRLGKLRLRLHKDSPWSGYCLCGLLVEAPQHLQVAGEDPEHTSGVPTV